MNKRITLTSAWRFRLNIGTVLQVLFLVLLACADPATLYAQERNLITLIPTQASATGETLQITNPTSPVTLTFTLSPLPLRAKVESGTFILVLSRDMDAQQTITITANLPQPTPFAEETYGPSTTKAGGRASWSADSKFLEAISTSIVPRKEIKFSLVLTPADARRTSTWYSLASSKSNNRPRLVLEYTVPGQPPVTQSDGLPAVQSPRAFLPSPTTFSYVIRPFATAWSYTPAFYKNLVFVLADDRGKKAVQALDPLGTQVWKEPLGNEQPGQHLLVSKSGQLYVVGNGKILRMQLDPDNPGKPPQPFTKFENSTLNPKVAPVLGLDGSLYFGNGLEVYGFNPDLQELWKVTLADTRTSLLTVGPSGKFLYLIGRNEGLVTINAQTGEYLVNALSNQETLKNIDNPTLHSPVVILHPDGTEIIYAAANSVNDGVLDAFNNDSGKITRRENWPQLAGLWSQPIPDSLPVGPAGEPNLKKKIYAVKVGNSQGTVEEIDWLNGTAADLKPQFGVGDSPYLLQGGNLAIDQPANRLVWNGKGGKDLGLYAFGLSFSGLVPANQSSGIPEKAQLYFGGDGTLYANDISGRTLWAIVPQFTLKPDSAANISSPTNLRVDGTVGKNTVLKAGGTVLLGPGFGVQKGATLAIGKP